MNTLPAAEVAAARAASPLHAQCVRLCGLAGRKVPTSVAPPNAAVCKRWHAPACRGGTTAAHSPHGDTANAPALNGCW